MRAPHRHVARFRAARLAMLALVGACSLGRAESGSIPAAPPGVVETGAPLFVVLGPEAMGLSSAPTDLHRLPDGRVLAVSQHEIAIGDGVRWEVYRAADGEPPIISQVVIDTDGAIYTGVRGGMARLVLGADARWRLKTEAEMTGSAEIRNVTMASVKAAAGNWHWYGGGGIVSWRPGQPLRVTPGTPSIARMFEIGPRVFFSEVAKGTIHELNPGHDVRHVAGRIDTGDGVISAAAFDEKSVLVGTVAVGFKLFDGTTLRPFGDGLGAGHRITDVCATTGGYFAAAFDGLGIVFFDVQGQIVQALERGLDHRLARVRRLLNSGDGVIWALLNDGVARIEFPSPISYFEPLIPSSISYAKPVRHRGKLWVQADGRLMRAVYNRAGRLERFEEDTPPGDFLFTLMEVDGILFASNERGVFVREQEEWKLAVPGIVNARVSRGAEFPRGHPYVARGEYGFIRREGDGYVAERFPVPQLGDNFNTVTDPHGVMAIELGTGSAARLDPRPEKPTLQFFGAEDGFTQGWVEVYVLEGVARFHLPNHLWRYDESTGKLVEDREFARRFPMLLTADGRPNIDPAGRLWYTAAGTAHVLEPQANGQFAGRMLPIRFEAFEYTVQDDGAMWLFANRRLARIDLRISSQPAEPLRALITSVQYATSSRHIFNPGDTLPPTPYSDNSVVVRFAAPANPFATPAGFEVLLEGAGSQWVSTGTVGSASFNRLKEGSYTLRVRPVAGNGTPGAEDRLAFSVLPPWHRTRLAWFAYAFSAMAVIAFAAWLSAVLQRREKVRLERLVSARTEELKTTNLQLSRQIAETTEKSSALAASEERYRTLNAQLEERVAQRTAELSLSNSELHHREALFRLILEHAPVGISWKRADLGNSHNYNATFRRILDLPSSSLPDYAPLLALVHPQDAARQAELNAQIRSGQSDAYNVEERFVLPSGRLVWASLSVAVVRNADGQIVQDIGILEDISARKQAEEELANTYKSLLQTSRMAGMAEVATGVLHNVGNVLNSLNVSAGVVATSVRHSKVESLVKLSTLLNEHAQNLGEFFAHDPKGKLVPGYVETLAQNFQKERDWLTTEIASMQKNIDHIKEIVAMQQGYAQAAGVVEILEASELFEDAVRMNSAALTRHDVSVVREFAPVPRVSVEKGKVLQILVNLIRNAKYACDDGQEENPREKIITLRIEAADADRVRLIVSDNGIGIPAENLTRIFAHGFTTRSYGHGFGLHSSALAAKEMKGSLSVASAGLGHGATFTLELPIAPHDQEGGGASPMPVAVKRGSKILAAAR